MSCITRCCPYSFWPSSLNNLSWFFRTLPPGWNSILQFLADEKPPQFLEADPGWTWSRPQQTLSLLQVGTASAKMLKQSQPQTIVFKKQVSALYLGRPWVMECTRAEVQWGALSPPQPTLSLLGATFKVSTSSFFQHGLAHNLSLNHYSGPGPDDLLFLQVSFLLIQNNLNMKQSIFILIPIGLDRCRREEGERECNHERPKVWYFGPSSLSTSFFEQIKSNQNFLTFNCVCWQQDFLLPILISISGLLWRPVDRNVTFSSRSLTRDHKKNNCKLFLL